MMRTENGKAEYLNTLHYRFFDDCRFQYRLPQLHTVTIGVRSVFCSEITLMGVCRLADVGLRIVL